MRIDECLINDFHGTCPAGEYDHLNVDCPVVIKQEGIEVKVDLPKLMESLVKSNRGVHRALSWLSRHYKAKAVEESDCRYKKTAEKISLLASIMAEHTTFV